MVKLPSLTLRDEKEGEIARLNFLTSSASIICLKALLLMSMAWVKVWA